MNTEELKYITPITEKVRNYANEMNSRYKQIENEIDKNKNKLSQLSNPNLLDNADFKIWDYGADGFTNAIGGYLVGRWVFWTADATKPFTILKGGDGGIKIHNNNAELVYMSQILLFDNIDYRYEHTQKTVTLSIDDDSSIVSLTAKLSGETYVQIPTKTGYVIFRKLYNNNLDDNRFVVDYIAEKSKVTARTIFYVKLEFGEIATPFSPKQQVVEELECSRYHRWLSIGTTGSVTDSTSIVLSARFETPMRIAPTVHVRNILEATSANQHIPPITNPVFVSASLTKYGIQFIHIGGGAGIQLPINSRIVLQSSNVIELDANIYP